MIGEQDLGHLRPAYVFSRRHTSVQSLRLNYWYIYAYERNTSSRIIDIDDRLSLNAISLCGGVNGMEMLTM
jgi:hypothetical protein